jgi:beta-glucanase (GH16 family)
MLSAWALLLALICGCAGGSAVNPADGATARPSRNAATPTITTTAAQNGATVVTLSDTTGKAIIYYTLDGSTPTSTSMQYFAPILVASNLTLKAIAVAPGLQNSTMASKDFTPGIASNTLVWSDEFANAGNANALPDSKIWTYDTGYRCCGNNELETYCAAGSATAPCDPASPNAYVDTAGILHVLGRKVSGTTYTSARLKTQGVLSFMYGRIEARMKLPESQGMWPAFWLLGNNIASISWPACGELDVMEHIDGSNPPFSAGEKPAGYDWIAGSVHGGSTSAHLDGTQKFHPDGFSAAAWHTYGMNWTKGQIQFYVDDPQDVYATFTPANFGNPWPFDAGPQFIILNLAIGGDWPGSPDGTTVFPGDMQVDYVRIYAN